MHFADQRRDALTHNCTKAVNSRLREHARGAAVPRHTQLPRTCYYIGHMIIPKPTACCIPPKIRAYNFILYNKICYLKLIIISINLPNYQSFQNRDSSTRVLILRPFAHNGLVASALFLQYYIVERLIYNIFLYTLKIRRVSEKEDIVFLNIMYHNL